MDQRDRPRTTPTDGRGRPPDPPPDDLGVELGPTTGNPSRRIPRLISQAGSKRVARHRLVGAAVATVVALGLVVAAGTGLARRLVGYVRTLPDYTLSYREIELEPPPPSWYRGGASAFLDQVWTVWPERKVFSTLDIDTARIQALFQRSPWVERVRKVEALPGRRLVVRLDYRVPVAIAEYADGTRIWVDRDGVILPKDDIDDELAAALVGLHGFAPPRALRFGETWSRVDPRTEERTPDERVVEAAALATFLKAHLAELTPHLAGSPHAVVQLVKERGLYVQIYGDSVADSLMVFWKHDPRSEPATARLDDPQKWALFRDWLARSAPKRDGKLVYLWFTRKGIEVDGRYGSDPATTQNDRRRADRARR